MRSYNDIKNGATSVVDGFNKMNEKRIARDTERVTNVINRVFGLHKYQTFEHTSPKSANSTSTHRTKRKSDYSFFDFIGACLACFNLWLLLTNSFIWKAFEHNLDELHYYMGLVLFVYLVSQALYKIRKKFAPDSLFWFYLFAVVLTFVPYYDFS